MRLELARWVLVIAMLAVARADEGIGQANAAYEAGQFAEAAEQYEAMLAEDGPRAGVLQNLGSAYFRMGDFGRAILAFERALLLEPRNPDLRANLKLARDEAAVFEDRDVDWREWFLGIAPRRGWSMIALGGALLLPLGAGLWVFWKRRRMVGAASAALGLLVLGVSLYALESRSDEADDGIVLGSPATVRISPFPTADERGSLAAGKRVNVGREEAGFRWVEAEAVRGWVAAGDVERLR